MKFTVLLLFTWYTQLNFSFAAKIKFHPPKTQAERTLDVILIGSGQQFVHQLPKDNIRKVKEVSQELYIIINEKLLDGSLFPRNYDQIFNKSSELFWTKALKDEVDYCIKYQAKQDGQEEMSSEYCTILSDCFNDFDRYLYNTFFEDDKSAYIKKITGQKNESCEARYYMIKKNGEWKLDGLHGGKYFPKFNYPSSNLANQDSDK